MSQKFKYIMLDGVTPIIFPDHIEHWVMASAFPNSEITSAGFIHDLTVGTAYGNSISLKVAAKETDTVRINKIGADD